MDMSYMLWKQGLCVWKARRRFGGNVHHQQPSKKHLQAIERVQDWGGSWHHHACESCDGQTRCALARISLYVSIALNAHPTLVPNSIAHNAHPAFTGDQPTGEDSTASFGQSFY